MLPRALKALVTAAIWVGLTYLIEPGFALSVPFLTVLGLMVVLNSYQPDYTTSDQGPREDRRSAQWIVPSVTLPNLVFTLEGALLSYPQSASFGPLDYAALTIAVLGLAIRIHAIHTLGTFFTWHVHIANNQALIETGLYRWLRHPSYLGAFLFFIALPLSLNAYFAAGLSLVLQASAYRYRIRIEEEAMTRRFGETYTAYTQRTYAYLPGIY